MLEKGKEITGVAMVEKEKMVVVMKQLNVAMPHVGSFVVTDGDGRRGGGEEKGGGEGRGQDMKMK
ncbi:hypothetical protein F2Q69_00051656 [Brassica cretica]|uniref:Uncharacterized protein n=1 Tax=Brassica cretica TaxID=69181 RepID=A0A8S9PLF4_BRACR|nr:hypothetical protein F2Q69_00051656 [Brassica cretica]